MSFIRDLSEAYEGKRKLVRKMEAVVVVKASGTGTERRQCLTGGAGDILRVVPKDTLTCFILFF
jgi:hypothetical protein